MRDARSLLYLEELHEALFLGSQKGISKATLGEMAHEIKRRFLAAPLAPLDVERLARALRAAGYDVYKRETATGAFVKVAAAAIAAAYSQEKP